MCIILDANRLGEFNAEPPDEDMKPVRRWVDKRNGKIAYADTKKFRDEWDRGGGYQLRRQLQRRGKLKIISNQDVEQKTRELEGEIASNDAHIIALALVADVKVLVSGDKALISDFKARVRRGKVYTRKTQVHLLKKDICP